MTRPRYVEAVFVPKEKKNSPLVPPSKKGVGIGIEIEIEMCRTELLTFGLNLRV